MYVSIRKQVDRWMDEGIERGWLMDFRWIEGMMVKEEKEDL